jgi:hypothetical protein
VRIALVLHRHRYRHLFGRILGRTRSNPARLSADRDSRSIAIVVNSGTAVERGDLLLDRNAGAAAELG